MWCWFLAEWFLLAAHKRDQECHITKGSIHLNFSRPYIGRVKPSRMFWNCSTNRIQPIIYTATVPTALAFKTAILLQVSSLGVIHCTLGFGSTKGFFCPVPRVQCMNLSWTWSNIAVLNASAVGTVAVLDDRLYSIGGTISEHSTWFDTTYVRSAEVEMLLPLVMALLISLMCRQQKSLRQKSTSHHHKPNLQRVKCTFIFQ